MTKKGNKALLIIDVQNDFCPAGSLAVERGDEIVPIINLITKKFYRVIATQDWHPEDHVSFAINHPNKNVFDTITINGVSQVLWPAHCVQGTSGADFHPMLDTKNFHVILRKGTNYRVDSYSAFMENDKKALTGLEGYLKVLRIEHVFICGLATDYCVFYSAMDAVKFGFDTYVVIDACRGVDVPENNVAKSIKAMKEAGIIIIESKDI